MLPKDSREEYIEDGKQAPQGTPAADIADGKYQRPLRDYGYLFDAYRLQITERVDSLEAAVRDRQMVENTLTDAKLQVQYWQKQGTVAKSIWADMARHARRCAGLSRKAAKKIRRGKGRRGGPH